MRQGSDPGSLWGKVKGFLMNLPSRWPLRSMWLTMPLTEKTTDFSLFSCVQKTPSRANKASQLQRRGDEGACLKKVEHMADMCEATSLIPDFAYSIASLSVVVLSTNKL